MAIYENAVKEIVLISANIAAVKEKNFPVFLLRCSRPFIVSVDDIMFQRPVEVGSLLLLSGQVGADFSSNCYLKLEKLRLLLALLVSDNKQHITREYYFLYSNEVCYSFSVAMIYYEL